VKRLLVVLALILGGVSSLTAQGNDFFTEAELFTALHWGMPDSTAREFARFMAAEDPTLQATLPEFRDVGPMATKYSEPVLLLLSLVSDEANRKVEQRLIDLHGGRELSAEERSEWEARRSDYRNRLIHAGKLPKK
jgi:hypothetical protein